MGVIYGNYCSKYASTWN